jgi:hypothetical protein
MAPAIIQIILDLVIGFQTVYTLPESPVARYLCWEYCFHGTFPCQGQPPKAQDGPGPSS